MIVVLADDLTGAAELGGIGLRYGLRVLLSATVQTAVAIDLLVVYTNTRSMPVSEAAAVMADLTRQATALKPVLIFKKTDSVLRGHVLAEMRAQMQAMGITKALLVPVNPALGRIITGGSYYVYRTPVHEAGFANDPEFPVLSSRILDMLGATEDAVSIIRKDQSVPANGIAVGEAESVEDLAHWADVSGGDRLFAGSASFFDALLRKRFAGRENPTTNNPELLHPLLFVSGTTYRKNSERIESLSHLAGLMPETVFLEPDTFESGLQQWSGEVVSHLQQKGVAVMAVGRQKGKSDPHQLRVKMGEAVKRVVAQTSVHEMLIEGGSTAYTIIEKLGWQTFVPTEEWAQGVVRMQVAERADVHLTIKPGSYEWPSAWSFETMLK